MKDSSIQWHLFWQALNKLETTRPDEWLARWVFADDAVRLSRKKTSSTEAGLADRGGMMFARSNEMTCERCHACYSDPSPAYRVYSEILSMTVCAACAVEALKLGMAVEPVSCVKEKAA